MIFYPRRKPTATNEFYEKRKNEFTTHEKRFATRKRCFRVSFFAFFKNSILEGNRLSKFMTIRQAAADPSCPLREGTLRAMVRRGECPGYYSGTRFWVDIDGLKELLMQKRNSVADREAKST